MSHAMSLTLASRALVQPPGLRLTGFTIPEEVKPVTDAMVREFIDDLRDSLAEWKPTSERAQTRDRVTVHLIDADQVDVTEDHCFQLGAERAIPALETLLMTLSAPGEAEATLTWPDGAEKRVGVVLHLVERLTPPPLDDAFAVRVGRGPDVLALVGSVRRHLEKTAQRSAREAAKLALLDAIIAANDVPVTADAIQRRVLERMREADYPARPSAREIEAVTVLYGDACRTDVQRLALLDRTARLIGVPVTARAVREVVDRQARATGQDAVQLMRRWKRNGQIARLRARLARDGAMAWLVARNRIV